MNNSLSNKNDLNLGIKYWLKGFENFTLGYGDVILIKSLIITENLTKSSSELGYSYKYGWSKLRKISKSTNRPIVKTSKGGSGGGGTVKVTPWGEYLVELFDMINLKVDKFTDDMNMLISQKRFKGHKPEKNYLSNNP